MTKQEALDFYHDCTRSMKGMEWLVKKSNFDRLMAVIDRKVKTYVYLITFTLNPAHGHTDYDTIEEYIKRQFFRKPLKVREAWIAREGDGVDIHVHWHVAVETDKFLTKDRFNYYTKRFGNIDFQASKVSNIQDAINYISKDGLPTDILRGSGPQIPHSQRTHKVSQIFEIIYFRRKPNNEGLVDLARSSAKHPHAFPAAYSEEYASSYWINI